MNEEIFVPSPIAEQIEKMAIERGMTVGEFAEYALRRQLERGEDDEACAQKGVVVHSCITKYQRFFAARNKRIHKTAVLDPDLQLPVPPRKYLPCGLHGIPPVARIRIQSHQLFRARNVYVPMRKRAVFTASPRARS